MTVRLKVRRVRPSDLPLPSYQTAHAAGMDLLADLTEEVVLEPMDRRLIPTGLALELPPGYEAQVRPRSGLALKQGLTCLNSSGTIDADYRGEVGVILANLSKERAIVRRGDRVAQLVVAAVARAEWDAGQADSPRGSPRCSATAAVPTSRTRLRSVPRVVRT
jgi:dUTP pyrophosphatase